MGWIPGNSKHNKIFNTVFQPPPPRMVIFNCTIYRNEYNFVHLMYTHNMLDK